MDTVSGSTQVLTNVGLERKRMRVTNTLAYNSAIIITMIKSFIIQFPGANPIKLFTAVIYGFFVIT